MTWTSSSFSSSWNGLAIGKRRHFDAMSDASDFKEQRREAAMEVAFDKFEFAADFNEDGNIEVRGETMWAWNIAQVWLPTFQSTGSRSNHQLSPAKLEVLLDRQSVSPAFRAVCA